MKNVMGIIHHIKDEVAFKEITKTSLCGRNSFWGGNIGWLISLCPIWLMLVSITSVLLLL